MRNCVAHSVWTEVSQAVRDALARVTLAEILRRHVSSGDAGQYVI